MKPRNRGWWPIIALLTAVVLLAVIVAVLDHWTASSTNAPPESVEASAPPVSSGPPAPKRPVSDSDRAIKLDNKPPAPAPLTPSASETPIHPEPIGSPGPLPSLKEPPRQRPRLQLSEPIVEDSPDPEPPPPSRGRRPQPESPSAVNFELGISLVLFDMTATTGGRIASSCASTLAPVAFVPSGDAPRLYLRSLRTVRSAYICGEVVGRPIARIEVHVNDGDVSTSIVLSQSTATLNRALSVQPGLVRIRVIVRDNTGQVSTVSLNVYAQ